MKSKGTNWHLFMTLLFAGNIIYGQLNSPLSPKTIEFHDTINDFIFDSLHHDLGKVAPINENNEITKYFKYIGTDSVYIVKSWTSDPYFICGYPKELLLPNQIYSYKVCFWNKNQTGSIYTLMGLLFSNDE